jgi:superfamily II DNA/RNA helicase
LVKWVASEFAKDTIEFLRSRTMAGLPHIGIIGPLDTSQGDSPVDIDDTDVLSLESIEDMDDGEVNWEFVPNRIRTQITIEPTDKNENLSKIDFYIRIKEGSDADVGDYCLKRGRNPKYVLTKQQLIDSFRHFEIFISTPKNSDDSTVRILVDGKETDFQTNIEKDNSIHKTKIIVTSESDPFLNYDRGSPVLLKQKYRIDIQKEVEEIDGKRRIKLLVLNNSPKTKRSVIPEMKDDENEDECKKRTLSGSKKTDNPDDDSLVNQWHPPFFRFRGDVFAPAGNRYGYLMEFKISEKLSSMNFPIDDYDMAKITNGIFDDSKLIESNGQHDGEIIFRDHVSFKENVPKMKSGGEIEAFIKKNSMNDTIAKVLSNDLKYKNLTKFQEDAISEIQETANSDEKDTVLISARTGGGKTEAFMLPILNKCLSDSKKGVKALIFYPTKALANDQASRFIEVMYNINKNSDRKITLGILHRDIAKNDEKASPDTTSGLPLTCPKCHDGLLKPTNSENLICSNEKCKETLDFVWAYTRTQTYANPPDILITNPDTMIWDLMLRPHHHSIFGRPVLSCNTCGMTYATKGKRKCTDGCGESNLEEILPTPPSFLVFDEVHLFKGSFGINTAYFLSRIEYTINEYAKKYHEDYPHRITKIGSSATISNTDEFIKAFFNSKKDRYNLIPKADDSPEKYYDTEADDSLNRYHVFVMPYAYSSDSTVGLAIQYMQGRAMNGKPPKSFDDEREKLGHYLQTLSFVNAVKSSNSLITQVRRTINTDLPDLQVDGHTTDFDKTQRSKVERDFNKQNVHVIFATSTLEVGVDFKKVHCVILNGFPYSFNDYLQRIGRGGRKTDSLVLTVCQNWKPIDHYYYSHGIQALRQQKKNIEPVAITRDNSEAIKKHLMGAVLDFIVRNKEEYGFDMEDISSFSTIHTEQEIRESLNKQVMESCNIPENLRDSYLADLDQFVYQLSEESINAAMSGIPRGMAYRFQNEWNPKKNLSSLRSTDPDVTIEVFWS